MRRGHAPHSCCECARQGRDDYPLFRSARRWGSLASPGTPGAARTSPYTRAVTIRQFQPPQGRELGRFRRFLYDQWVIAIVAPLAVAAIWLESRTSWRRDTSRSATGGGLASTRSMRAAWGSPSATCALPSCGWALRRCRRGLLRRGDRPSAPRAQRAAPASQRLRRLRRLPHRGEPDRAIPARDIRCDEALGQTLSHVLFRSWLADRN
jgi:hypothetical protein